MLDSGIYPSADFGNRITAFYDFTQGGIASAPYDDYGHGTHVAGLIGGTVYCQAACTRVWPQGRASSV